LLKIGGIILRRKINEAAKKAKTVEFTITPGKGGKQRGVTGLARVGEKDEKASSPSKKS